MQNHQELCTRHLFLMRRCPSAPAYAAAPRRGLGRRRVVTWLGLLLLLAAALPAAAEEETETGYVPTRSANTCVEDLDCDDQQTCDLSQPCPGCAQGGDCACEGVCVEPVVPCQEDHECRIDQICDENHVCVLGTPGCEEGDAGDRDPQASAGCHRIAATALDPATVAATLNARFIDDLSGVLIHFVDGATEQETKWQFCTDVTDPGCADGTVDANAVDDPDEPVGPEPPRTTTCGRSAFSVLNHYAWSYDTSSIDTWQPKQREAYYVVNPMPPAPGFVGNTAMLAAVTCFFPGDADSGRR